MNKIYDSSEERYGCLMLYADISKDDYINTVHEIVDLEDIYEDPTGEEEYGYETEAHVTVLWGIHYDNVLIDNIVKTFYNIKDSYELEIEGIGVFENDDYDVVKFDVIPNKRLLHLRDYCINTFENTQTFDDFHPHMTIAYVKKGLGKKYLKKFNKSFYVNFTKIVYSNPEYKKIYYNIE